MAPKAAAAAYHRRSGCRSVFQLAVGYIDESRGALMNDALSKTDSKTDSKNDSKTDKQKFRLVTRSDFDGLVCAVLLKELDLIDDILFVHPKDMQDGKIPITDRDITTNLPYVAGAHLSFDHHASELIRNTGERANHVI